MYTRTTKERLETPEIQKDELTAEKEVWVCEATKAPGALPIASRTPGDLCVEVYCSSVSALV